MSEYTVVDAEMTDADCIKLALNELGYTSIEEHEVAQPLVGYGGDTRQQKANLIIRRKNIGSVSNDIGFVKTADGKYQMIISEYDARASHGKKFTEQLKQLYSSHKVTKQVKKMGYRVKSKTVDADGRIKIKVSA